MDKKAALRKTELFGSLTAAEIAVLASACRERTVKTGEILFSTGDEAPGLYVVVTGTLKAFRVNAEGREQVIHVEKAGSTIAEVPVFDDKPAPSTVAAESDSTVLFLPKPEVRRLCLAHPGIALATLKVLAGRLRRTVSLIESLALKGVDQRLAAHLCQEFAEKKAVKMVLPPNTVLAARLGTVREVISRAFAKLEAAGVVALEKGRTVVLLDGEGLRKYAGD